MNRKGIWVSPNQFVEFADNARQNLTAEIASRDRSPDFNALGQYLPNPDPVLKKMGRDIAVYRDLRADAHVGGCIRRRKAAVKALEWRIEQGNATARVTKRIDAIFQRLDLDHLRAEAMEAALYGYQPLEVMWTKAAGFADGWNVPERVVAKPPEWFLFDPESRLRFRSKDRLFDGELLPERKFLLPRQDASYANPYGIADLSMCFWPATFKRGGLKFWVVFTEKYGTPWLIGKTPRGTPKTETDRLLDQLEAMVQDAVAVIPDDSSVDIVGDAARTSSSSIYQDLLMYCRSEISIALLGQNQTTEANANRASATAGLEVTREIRDSDVTMIEQAMNELIRWIIEINSDGEAPTFKLFEQAEIDDTQAKRDDILSRTGVKFTKSYYMRSYDLRDDDLEVVAPPSSPTSPQGGAANGAAFSESGTRSGCPCCSGVEFSDGQNPSATDALDQAVTAEMDQWQAVLAPMVDPLQKLIDEAIQNGETADQLLSRLPDLLTPQASAALQAQLTRQNFIARLAAASGLQIDVPQ